MSLDIERLGRQAVEIIKEKWGLPETGFIAGGAIANIVWELVSGTKAVVNDIDVFIFNGVIEQLDSNRQSLFQYQEKTRNFFEDYRGLNFRTVTKEFYTITDVSNNGIFNKIIFKSNVNDTSMILRSFDINATRIGYLIDEDKLYWTDEFSDFISTGNLKVCNLMTPSHTAIRIVKKQQELQCQLDRFEIDLLRYCHYWRFGDTIKLKFKKRYYDMFQAYSKNLEQFFEIRRDKLTEELILETHGVNSEIYALDLKDGNDLYVTSFQDPNLGSIYTSTEFLFYMRNIYNNSEFVELWKKLYFFFSDADYVDCQPENSDLELLNRLGKYAPNSIKNLKGLKLSEQIKIVKSVLEIYQHDPLVAISILEKHKIIDIELDSQNLLLLELSVRREIVNDTKNKVGNILDPNKYNDVVGNEQNKLPF
jgi:hypothetical protein